MTKLIAPSILAADFSRLGDEIRAVEAAGADWIHLDVMDGHFVPNLTLGPALAGGIRSVTALPLDTHLMVDEPLKFIEAFIEAGVNWISVHAEADDPANAISLIKDLGGKAGIAINPPTSVDAALPYLAHADYVLVMTVNPGFAGQAMIDDCIRKIGLLRAFREAQNLRFLIQVDGGINVETVDRVRHADIIVAGNGIFKTPDYRAAIEQMRHAVTS